MVGYGIGRWEITKWFWIFSTFISRNHSKLTCRYYSSAPGWFVREGEGWLKNVCNVYKIFTHVLLHIFWENSYSFHYILQGGLWSTKGLSFIRVVSVVFQAFLMEVKLAFWYSGMNLRPHTVATTQNLGLMLPLWSQSHLNKTPDC